MVLHHLYLTRYCLYCVLFDMRQLLRTAATKARKRALGILRFWLNSIMVHTVGTEEDDDCCAPFVLVGTHKDLVPSAQDHAAISKVLHQHFGSHPAWPSLQRNRGTGERHVHGHFAHRPEHLRELHVSLENKPDEDVLDKRHGRLQDLPVKIASDGPKDWGQIFLEERVPIPIGQLNL